VAALTQHIESVEDQQALRGMVEAAGLVAFVRDGAILPRAAGNSDAPMQAAAGTTVVAFRSPDSLRAEFALPNCGKVRVVSWYGERALNCANDWKRRGISASHDHGRINMAPER
jgi:predicted ABC-class ATPase